MHAANLRSLDTLLTTRRRLLLGSAASLALAACGRARNHELHLAGTSMASAYNVKLVATGAVDAERVHAAVHDALDAVDLRMSLFRADAELAGLNRQPAAQPLTLSPELFTVLSAAQEISALSDGAFDVTVAPLVQSWGFGTDKHRTVPAAERIGAQRAAVGWRGLQLDPRAVTATKLRADLQVDLGGIAAGYGVDRAAAALDAQGIGDYMVELGGEVRTRGCNGAGQPWRIGIEQPDATPRRARWVVPLTAGAVATSGDYRNFFTADGRRYSHEIDPATAAPIAHDLCSVTVVAADATRADALSTALIVLGAQRGRALARAQGIAALFVERGADGSLRDSMSPAFAALQPVRA